MPEQQQTIRCDVVIFGGGVAGLWTLHTLLEAGYHAVLLEAFSLGQGQTVASQGIIHGGLKYTLRGMFNESARAIRDMPHLWRECIEARHAPDLSATTVRSQWCALWRTSSLTSRLGMVGAQSGLTVKPTKLAENERPLPLRQCPGEVLRLDEQVIDPVTLIAALSGPRMPHVLRLDGEHGLEFETTGESQVRAIHLAHTTAEGSRQLTLAPSAVILAAGGGNERLREQIGLPNNAMQRRPLHMVMLRGDLPDLNGHCVDGAKTRVTITTARDAAGRTIWQLGGQLAEDGVGIGPQQLIDRAARELHDVLPGFDVGDAQWGTYRVDRAEAQNEGRRPEDATIRDEGNVLTAWPTKLVLAPILAERLKQQVETMVTDRVADRTALPTDWPRPDVALPPWEFEANWKSAR